MNEPISAALVAAVLDDSDALDKLAAALGPRLAAVTTTGDNPAGLTTAQAAQRAGLHERTIRRALAAGTLAGRTVAGRWRIDPESLDEWLSVGAPTSTAPTHHNGRGKATATAGADAISGRAA